MLNVWIRMASKTAISSVKLMNWMLSRFARTPNIASYFLSSTRRTLYWETATFQLSMDMSY
jgi:hypothetical protein